MDLAKIQEITRLEVNNQKPGNFPLAEEARKKISLLFANGEIKNRIKPNKTTKNPLSILRDHSFKKLNYLNTIYTVFIFLGSLWP